MRFGLEQEGFRRVPRRDFFSDVLRRPSHNNVVAWGLRDRVVLTDVMRLLLEPDFYESLDWKRIRIEESIFVDAHNRLSLDDVRFLAPYQDGSGVQRFVGEHKSKPELRAFQQLSIAVWRDAIGSSRRARGVKSDRSYLTVPFLFYTGKSRWIFGSPAPSLRKYFLISPKTRLFNESCDDLFYKFSVVRSNWRAESLDPRTVAFFDLLERVATRSNKIRSYDWIEPLRGLKGDESVEKFKYILSSYWSDSLIAIEKRALSQRQILDIVAELGDEGAIQTMNATFKLLIKEGQKEGRNKGRRQGERKRNTDLIVRKLNARFGRCPEQLIERVDSYPSRASMNILVDAAYESASLEEFESIVDSCLESKGDKRANE